MLAARTVADLHEVSQLRRSGDDKMLAGVAGGIARYLNADITPVRVIIAALGLFTGAAVAVNIAAWLLIPGDGEGQPAAAALADTWGRRRSTSRRQAANRSRWHQTELGDLRHHCPLS